MEPFECVTSVLGSCGSVWPGREAGQQNHVLGCLGSVWECFGMLWERVKASGIVSERFGSSWSGLERLNAFRLLRERMGAFGRLGKLCRLGKHNPIWYEWYVCSIIIKTKILQDLKQGLVPLFR